LRKKLCGITTFKKRENSKRRWMHGNPTKKGKITVMSGIGVHKRGSRGSEECQIKGQTKGKKREGKGNAMIRWWKGPAKQFKKKKKGKKTRKRKTRLKTQEKPCVEREAGNVTGE